VIGHGCGARDRRHHCASAGVATVLRRASANTGGVRQTQRHAVCARCPSTRLLLPTAAARGNAAMVRGSVGDRYQWYKRDATRHPRTTRRDLHPSARHLARSARRRRPALRPPRPNQYQARTHQPAPRAEGDKLLATRRRMSARHSAGRCCLHRQSVCHPDIGRYAARCTERSSVSVCAPVRTEVKWATGRGLRRRCRTTWSGRRRWRSACRRRAGRARRA
jgi:hypothetical protein